MPELQTLIKILAVMLVVCLVLSVIFHMPRAAVVLVILAITVPVLCTVMWGDGQKYVSKVASLFTPEIEQQINDGYKIYHDANAENPVVDLDQINTYMNKAKGSQEGTASQNTTVFPAR